MADYKRMVSYMYIYDKGIKRRNVGYARVEERNGECRITLHMQLPGILDCIFPTYLIQRQKGDMELVYLGDSALKNHMVDSRLTADAGNIMGSGYRLSDMGGILLFLNEGTYFATEWDDKPVVLDEVMGALKPKAAAAGIGKKDREETGNAPVYTLPRGWKTMELLRKEWPPEPVNPWETVEKYRASHPVAPESSMEQPPEPLKPREQQTRGEVTPLAAETARRIEEISPMAETARRIEEISPIAEQTGSIEETSSMAEQTGSIEETSSMAEQTGSIEETSSMTEQTGNMEEAPPLTYQTEEREQEKPVAEKYFEKYPRIYPFEDNEVIMCVKIEPKDIGNLPVDAWVLSNNSFLLHGYYCYHHLIFAKLKDRFGTRYILGVPGIYHNRERFMARMFGFECFKSIRKRELRQGDFGYWYMPIPL